MGDGGCFTHTHVIHHISYGEMTYFQTLSQLRVASLLLLLIDSIQREFGITNQIFNLKGLQLLYKIYKCN